MKTLLWIFCSKSLLFHSSFLSFFCIWQSKTVSVFCTGVLVTDLAISAPQGHPGISRKTANTKRNLQLVHANVRLLPTQRGDVEGKAEPTSCLCSLPCTEQTLPMTEIVLTWGHEKFRSAVLTHAGCLICRNNLIFGRKKSSAFENH